MPTIISGDGTITGLTSTGISAVQNLPAGSVKQVVSAVQNYVTTTSASLVDTGLTATITPTSTSNRVLVLVNLPSISAPSANWSFVLTDGSNNVIQNLVNYNGSAFISSSYSILLSPSTISAITYKVRYSVSGGNTLRLADYSANLHPATITLMEIVG